MSTERVVAGRRYCVLGWLCEMKCKFFERSVPFCQSHSKDPHSPSSHIVFLLVPGFWRQARDPNGWLTASWYYRHRADRFDASAKPAGEEEAEGVVSSDASTPAATACATGERSLEKSRELLVGKAQPAEYTFCAEKYPSLSHCFFVINGIRRNPRSQKCNRRVPPSSRNRHCQQARPQPNEKTSE